MATVDKSSDWDILEKLDLDTLKADRQIGQIDESTENLSPVDNTNHTTNDNKTAVNGTNNSKNGQHLDDVTSETNIVSRKPPSGSPKENGSPTSDGDNKSKSKNPFKFLKKLKSQDKEKDKDKKPTRKPSKLDKMLADVKVDTLPQKFVTKYLGFKKAKGLYGIKYTRDPIEELVEDIGKRDKKTKDDLPLINIKISVNGIDIGVHKSNRCKQVNLDEGLLPIEFISYGVQDIKYTRIFTYITVREMSAKSKNLECHAFLCDSTVTARKLALSLALAFKEYAKNLKGKPYKFQVDLRSTSELEADLEDEEEEECEA